MLWPFSMPKTFLKPYSSLCHEIFHWLCEWEGISYGPNCVQYFFQENTLTENTDRNFACYAKNILGTQWN